MEQTGIGRKEIPGGGETNSTHSLNLKANIFNGIIPRDM